MMEDFDISLKHDIKPLHKWKDDDTFLMQEISKGSYTPQELQKINQVKQYLQVVTLAYITMSDGTKLKKDIINGIKQSSCSSKFYSCLASSSVEISYHSIQRRGVWIMAGYHQRKDNHQEDSYTYL